MKRFFLIAVIALVTMFCAIGGFAQVKPSFSVLLDIPLYTPKQQVVDECKKYDVVPRELDADTGEITWSIADVWIDDLDGSVLFAFLNESLVSTFIVIFYDTQERRDFEWGAYNRFFCVWKNNYDFEVGISKIGNTEFYTTIHEDDGFATCIAKNTASNNSDLRPWSISIGIGVYVKPKAGREI